MPGTDEHVPRQSLTRQRGQRRVRQATVAIAALGVAGTLVVANEARLEATPDAAKATTVTKHASGHRAASTDDNGTTAKTRTKSTPAPSRAGSTSSSGNSVQSSDSTPQSTSSGS